ncbi:MAG: hypothetical protein EZS28_002797, partial [Streblomastix strix]
MSIQYNHYVNYVIIYASTQSGLPFIYDTSPNITYTQLATFGIHVLIVQLCVVVRIIIQNVPEIPWELGNLKFLRLRQNTLLQLAGF